MMDIQTIQNIDEDNDKDLVLSEEPLVKVRKAAPLALMCTQITALVNKRIRPYQRDGVKFLYDLYKQGKGGILGDGKLLFR